MLLLAPLVSAARALHRHKGHSLPLPERAIFRRVRDTVRPYRGRPYRRPRPPPQGGPLLGGRPCKVSSSEGRDSRPRPTCRRWCRSVCDVSNVDSGAPSNAQPSQHPPKSLSLRSCAPPATWWPTRPSPPSCTRKPAPPALGSRASLVGTGLGTLGMRMGGRRGNPRLSRRR